ncbi:MAG: cytochrome b N-terminal domain-containing protein [Intrasporangium sp.]|uniref:cytochrome b n=1 Tax=Intrasporangium sp. TaxID=1925024 RepID=UPI00264725FE|nr:cytochrome b N-terminal domain-containing protein [Intrasporangium sp.]MDN5796792.1 cytochrome b N-terminal domain-containing protein [Intrasporangium sp.]
MIAMSHITKTRPVAHVSRGRRFVGAVDERLGLDALRYPVPEHANNLAWSLGGLTAVSLAILIATGVVLAQFYDPTPEVANASVRTIVEDVALGGFIRSLHFWAAQAMYVLAALHLIRVFFHGSYKRPREANWLIGVSMFGLTLLALFTGTVLKWDQEGYEALAHNLELGQVLGGAGFWFSTSFAAHTPILVRLYSAHIMLIPGLIVILVTLHALLIKRHKISSHPGLPAPAPDTPAALEPGGTLPAPRPALVEVSTPPGETYLEAREPFTHHLRRVGAFGLVLLAVLSIVAVLFPPPVGPTPVAGVEVTKPMWPFWWMFTLENWFGLPAILWGGLALFGLLFAVPFIDRNPKRSWRTRPVAMTLAALVILALVVLTIFMGITTPAAHL